MLLVILAATAAGAVVLPEPVGNMASWLGFEDYPRGELRLERGGSILFKTVINPDGKVDLCLIEVAVAQENDRAAFCKTVEGRFRFRRATASSGQPRYYVLERTFNYFLPGGSNNKLFKAGADFKIEVSRLPGGAQRNVEVTVNVAVDQSGSLLQCSPLVDAPQMELSRVACDQLPKIWKPRPEVNKMGQPITYVRAIRVEFGVPTRAAS